MCSQYFSQRAVFGSLAIVIGLLWNTLSAGTLPMKGGSLTINMQGAASAEPTPEELRSIVLFLTSSLGRLPTDEDLMSAVATLFRRCLNIR